MFDSQTYSDLQGKLSRFPFSSALKNFSNDGADVNCRLDSTLFSHFAYARESECLNLWHGRELR